MLMSTSPSVWRPGALLPTLALVLLALLGCNRGLWTPDEPREAEISREMLLNPGVIPTLNGERFIEKPPLYYWTVAGLFRLSGGPSVGAARAVSVAAAVATLALLVAWGSAAHSRTAGWLAALMLATSLQFLVSSHWVLIDPLLMLSTTVAAWSAWELLARRDAPWLKLLFPLSLVLALWIKGLVGPVLVVAGLVTFLLIDRPSYWRRLRPVSCTSLMLLAVLLLGLAIWEQGGNAALWEWGYVNHVQRLLNPSGASGHRQPPLYYAWTLPFALLPWLAPFFEGLRPSAWRRVHVPGLPMLADPARYGAIVSAGMLLVLSVSATKRETYLLPLLPLIFLWLGIRTTEWWQQWQGGPASRLGMAWWLQALLLGLYALGIPVAAWVWLRRPDMRVIAALLIDALCVGVMLSCAVRGQRLRAARAALGCAVAGSAVTLWLAASLLDPIKDMGPFVREVSAMLPPRYPVYALGVDETLRAEFPFYSGRPVMALRPAQHPEWVVQQDNHDGRAVNLSSSYDLLLDRSFGSGRTLQLWRLRFPVTPP